MSLNDAVRIAVRSIRKQRGESYRKFAEGCGMRSSALFEIERKGRDPSIATLDKILSYVGMNYEEFGKVVQDVEDSGLEDGEHVLRT